MGSKDGANNLPSSASGIIKNLKHILGEAVKCDLIVKNPFADLKLNHKCSSHTNYLTIDQVKKIIDSDVGKFLLGLTALLTLGKKQVIAGAVGLIAYDIGKTNNAAPGSSTARVKDMNITTKLFKARTEEYKIITASNKAKTELDKLKDKFDLERIGLTAALNAATDAETKLRIQAQLAILDNNEALAKKILAEMEAAEAAKKLALSVADLEAAFKATIARLLIYDPVRNIAPGQTGLFPSNVSNVPSVPFVGTPFGQAGSTSNVAPTEIKITVDTSAGGDRLSQAIAESIQVATRNGYSTVPAGQGF
jgi:hypothetical protein